MYSFVLLIFVERDSEHQLEVYLKHDLIKIYFKLERGVQIPSLPSGFEDLRDVDDAAEALVRLLQLCVEYMLHVQESLITDASKAELGLRKALDEVSDVEAKLSLEKARRRAAARQCYFPKIHALPRRGPSSRFLKTELGLDIRNLVQGLPAAEFGF